MSRSRVVGSYGFTFKIVWQILINWLYILHSSGIALLGLSVFNFSPWSVYIVVSCGIYIFLMISDVEYLFICIVAIVYLIFCKVFRSGQFLIVIRLVYVFGV